MIKKVFYALAMMSGLAVNAQDVDIKWDKETKRVIGVNRNGDAIYEFDEVQQKIDKYDGTRGVKYMYANGKTIAVMYGVNKGAKTMSFEVQEIENGKLTGPSKQLASIEYNDSRVGLIGVIEGNSDTWGVKASDDKTKFLNISTYNNFDSHSPERLHFTVFDDNLNILWTKEFKPEYTDMEFDLEDAIITNDGRVVLIAKYSKPGKIDTKVELSYDFKICALTDKSEKEVTLKLPSGGLPVSIVGCEAGNGKIAIGGVYASNTKYGSRNGTYIGLFDLAGTIDANITPFSDEIFSELGYKKVNADHNIYNMQAVNLLKFEDGSLALVAAEIDNMVRFANNMIVIGYTSQGKIRFETGIVNNFETHATNNDINSYIVNGNLWLFYNKENGSRYRFKATAVNNEGKVIVDKELDIASLERNVQVYPWKSFLARPNTIVVKSQLSMESSVNGIITIK